MQKSIDIKNRVVDIFDVDTGLYEDEIVSYLKRKMKVRFHSARFNNSKYVFTGNPDDKTYGAITVSGYRKKQPNERYSIDIG